MKSVFLLSVLSLAACAQPEPAPTELNELCAWTYRNAASPENLPEALTNMDAWLTANADPEVPGFSLPALTADDVLNVEHPDRDPAAAIGAMADGASSHALDQHVSLILLADQQIVAPDDYARYDRTFLEGGDCFSGEVCDTLITSNDIIKTLPFDVTIPYIYRKEYRWVHFTSADGAERRGVVSQGSVALESFGSDGTNGILQSYTLDVFVEGEDGGVHRVQAQWAELALAIDPGVDYMTTATINGLQEVFSDTDAAIDALGL